MVNLISRNASRSAIGRFGPRFRIGFWRWVACIALSLIAVTLILPSSRRFLLLSAGHALVEHSTAVDSADVIVVAIDSGGAGTLEAADLVHRGVSQQVAVFHDPPTAADREFLRRGLPYDDRAAISTHQLRILGVEKIEQIPRSTTGSEEEGEILPGWCQRRGYRSVVIVTSADHSRRIARILHRALRGNRIGITVIASPYSSFNPDSWWKTRAGTRTEIVESEKLLLDMIRHPFS